ncbi:MAG: glycoside hydrolase [Candidatus Sumerlaeaceae bacterium]|nr:glycoside hydrolase [Candidatus Sumerlaeaceae bacterium]
MPSSNMDPVISTDRAGNWLAVWATNDTLSGTKGTDFDIVLSRSTTNGTTWTTPVLLNSNGTLDSGNDTLPWIATDGTGHWMVVWTSQNHPDGISPPDRSRTWMATSVDNGQTWSLPTPVSPGAVAPPRQQYHPRVSVGQGGRWVAAWSGMDPATTSTPHLVQLVWSDDFGLSWTAPLVLNASAGQYSPPTDDFAVDVGTDAAGKWMAAWSARSDNSPTTPTKVHFVRSVDNAESWTAPQLLNPAGTQREDYPHVTAGAGDWFIGYRRNSGPSGEPNASYGYSKDDGGSWYNTAIFPKIIKSAPGAPFLNVYEYPNSRYEQSPFISPVGAGDWAAFFSFKDTSAFGYPNYGTDSDIAQVTTHIFHDPASDLEWSAPARLFAGSYGVLAAGAPQVATDNNGIWMVTWSVSGLFGPDADVFYSRSTDDGKSWTIPVLLNSDGAYDLYDDTLPDIAADGNGAWMAVWCRAGAEVVKAVSTDNGITWYSPAPLSSQPQGTKPKIASPGPFRWIATWSSSSGIKWTRSENSGVNWTTPFVLFSKVVTGGAVSSFQQSYDDPDVTAVGNGTFAIGASKYVETVSSAIYRTKVFGFETNYLLDSGTPYGFSTQLGSPQVATDGMGHWVGAGIAVRESGTQTLSPLVSNYQLLVNRSNLTLPSATPSAEFASLAGACEDSSPNVATDGSGRWRLVWRRSGYGDLYGSNLTSHLVSGSADNGANWTPPKRLETAVWPSGAIGSNLEMRASRTGEWVAVWVNNDGGGNTLWFSRMSTVSSYVRDWQVY